MAIHILSFPLLILTTLVVSSLSIPLGDNIPSWKSQELVVATQEMARANYFAYIMLINLAPPDPRLQSNITFLMPNDRLLASTVIPEGSVLHFLLRHSIPSPLLIDHLDRIPSGSFLPSCEPNYMLGVANKGRRNLHLNNVRITSPNLCTSSGTSIRCHGIDGVLEDVEGPPFMPACPSNISIPIISTHPINGQVIPPDPIVQLPPDLPFGFPGGDHHSPPDQNEFPNTSGSSPVTKCVPGRTLSKKVVNLVMILLVCRWCFNACCSLVYE